VELFSNLWSDDSGQGLVEYALIIALVAIGLILALLFLRNAIGNIFVDISNELNNAPSQQFQPS
jgi:pilus assembly protein Flp/PilA